MKSRLALITLSVAPFAAHQLHAQPYHTDTTVGGTQTLEVEGDLSVKQYGGGLGGDLKVVGEAHLGTAAQALSFSNPEASGVTGYFWGPLKIGQSTSVVEYRFSKTGDETNGSFKVPLGLFNFGEPGGELLQVDIATGNFDSNSGAAHYTLMCKRHHGTGELTAVSHQSFGGGVNATLKGWNADGGAFLALDYVASSNAPGFSHLQQVTVRITSFGVCDPHSRSFDLANMTSIKEINAFTTALASNYVVGTKQSISADEIHLNGDVSFAATAGSASNIVLNGGAGRITLSGAGSGVYAGANPVFTLDGSGNVAFAGGSALNIANNTSASSSTTGALTIAGGVGIGMDSYINGVRVGRGNNNIATNTVLGAGAMSGNGSFAARNTAVGSSALGANYGGTSNTAVGANSMAANTSGLQNAAFGSDSLSANTTGTNNTAVGHNAMRNNTTGAFNVAVGMTSMQYNTSGGGNSALGHAALAGNTTGAGNTAMGYYSMIENTTGQQNVALGVNAASFLNGGNFNVILGASAGVLMADGDLLVSPENSVYIGANSRGKDDSDSNSIVIGANAIGEGANTTVIGNASTTRARIHGDIETPGGLKIGGDTVLEGKVTIAAPQGDISMGIYE